MEQNKKRRNSILKKPQTNCEESTTEITSKLIRRISFSGKKSVKEFRPGEEEATIWGTSYEESAEGLHANSTESGLVNVNEKRIILRNRRVIVEPNQATQRRSKKKVSVAENDKENVFTQQSPAEVSLIDKNTILPPAIESPVKSEMDMLKMNFEDKNSQTMLEPLDRGNICSSTFDFINYSGLISKSITIEQSVDVTLNENELQLFKFRVPVTATDVSPQLSLNSSRDSLSPNIFSQSILMSEEDLNMLKLIRRKRGTMDFTGSHLTEMEAKEIADIKREATPIEQSADVLHLEQQEAVTNSRQSDLMQLIQNQTTDANQSMNVSEVAPHTNGTQRKTIIKVMDMEEDSQKSCFINTAKGTSRGTLLVSQNMNVSQVAEAKSLKRKTITKVENMNEGDSFRIDRRTTSHPTAMDCSSLDVNSPLRKKPMHSATNKQIDSTNETSMNTSEAEPTRRQTIHFESAVVEETLTNDVDEMVSQSPINVSMEQSFAVPSAGRETIYFDHNQIREDSICQSTRPSAAVKRDVSDSVMRVIGNKYVDIIEDSPKSAKSNATSCGKNRHTIYTPVDINEETPSHAVSIVKPRQSIYASCNIFEDSTSLKREQKSKVTESIKFADIAESSVPALDSHRNCESIFMATDITIEDSPKAATVGEPYKSTVVDRQTIYSSIDDRDIPTQVPPSKGGVKQRQSNYTPIDIIEDSPKAKVDKFNVAQHSNDVMEESLKETAVVVQIPTKIPSKQRHTIYPSSDILKDSPKPVKQPGIEKRTSTQRQTICTPSDMIESTLDGKSNVICLSEIAHEPPEAVQSILKASFRQRQSKTTSDPLKIIKPMEAPKLAQRQSIYTPSDMIMVEDSPKGTNKSIVLQRKTTYAPSEMTAESLETLKSTLKADCKQSQTKTHRPSVYTAADMVEDSPKMFKSTETQKCSILQRKSTHIVTDMAEDSSKKLQSSLTAGLKQPHRQTIYDPADMIEECHQAEPLATKPPAPKIVVTHFDLKQGISGQQAVLRNLKNRQAKTKLLTEAIADDSSVEIPVHNELPASANKMNFCQLNEEMLKGNTNAFAEQRKGKSLFDALENKPNEEIKFDSFMSKASMTDCRIQPARNSMKDYTMELSMKDLFSNQKKRDSGYTMDLSLENRPTIHLITPISQSEQETLHLNASQAIHKFHSNSKDYDLSTNASKNSSKRQTINVHNEMDLDGSRAERVQSASNSKDGPQNDIYSIHSKPDLEVKSSTRQTVYLNQDLEVEQQQAAPLRRHLKVPHTYQAPQTCKSAKRATIHLNDDIELDAEDQGRQTKIVDETKRNTAGNTQRIPRDELVFKTKRNTIHFNQDLEMEEDPIDQHLQYRKSPAPSRENIEKQHISDLKESRRPTLLFNDDIQFDGKEEARQSALSDETKRNTADNGHRTSVKELVTKTSRQTIHFNQDVEVEEEASDKHLQYRKSPAPSRENIQKQQISDLKESRRPTLLFNDDIQFDGKEEARQSALSDETKRNTADNGHRTSVKELVTKTSRQTIHFNQDVEVEEEASDKHLQYRKSLALSRENIQKQQISDLKESRRPTLHFNDDIEFDEEEQACQTELSDETKRNTADNGHRTSVKELVTKTSRQTIHFNQDVEVEEEASDKHLQYRKSPAPSRENIQKQQISDLKASRRPTLHCNDDIEFDDEEQARQTELSDETKRNTAGNAHRIPPNELASKTSRQTIHFNQDVEVEEDASDKHLQYRKSLAPSRETIEKQHIRDSKVSRRPTLLFNDDIEFDGKEEARQSVLSDETKRNTADNGHRTFVKELVTKTSRQTIHFNQDVEVEEEASDKHLQYRKSPAPSRENIQKQQISDLKASRRPTLHLNDDIEFDEEEQARQTELSDETKRNTANNGHRTFDKELAPKTKRQTIYFNQDVDVEDDPSDKHFQYRKSPAPSRENIQKQQIRNHTESSRLILHLNDDIESNAEEEEEEARRTALPDETKRNTADNAQRVPPNDVVFKTSRQTIHFNQDVEVEEDTSDKQNRKSSALTREIIQKQYIADAKTCDRTRHFNDDIELDEDARRTALFEHTKQNAAGNAQRNRQTVHFHQNNDIERSVLQLSRHDPTEQENTLRGLPKPRRLTNLDDQPLDVDVSPQKCTIRKSSFSRTLNFNEIQTTTSKIQQDTNPDAAIQQMPLPADDDSPLSYFSAKSKGHDITSEMDRSLATYLKVEEEFTLFRNISQDTSLGTVKSEEQNLQIGHDVEQESQSKRKITHKPVNIFEESGINEADQSIQMDMTAETRSCMQANRINLKSLDGPDRFKRSEPPNVMEETRPNLQGNRISLKMFDDLEQNKNPRLCHEAPSKILARKTILAPAAMECDSLTEMSVLSEEKVKPAKPKEAIFRKTIHFTNENAVDESFFDENLSKPVAAMKQMNRQTVFFNESMNPEMDVTVSNCNSMPKSKAAQSMKEILLENKMLFTQSRLLQPSTFEDKRSTIYFTGKDDSLEMTTVNESMDCDLVDVECATPTKNKLSKSRIPQLIDSARKLQSLKKSMEYIQQELPNIGCHFQKGITTVEQDDLLQKNLQQSFNSTGATHESVLESFEIPRRAVSHSSKKLQESLDTDTEKPDQVRLQESYDTIEIPRRVTAFQKNETLQLCSNATINTTQKSLFEFEDAPVTISNVSTFFSQRPLPATNESYSPNTTEALCNLDVNVITVDDQLPKSSDSEDTTHHIDKFKKRYVDLTCDSIRLSGLMEDIDKTRLSLVNTLDEEASEIVLPSNCAQQVPTETASPLKPMASVCRKCKCRLSMTQNDTTIGSFMLEPEPEYELDFTELEELASKPKIRDVAKVWRQRMRESDSFNVSEISRSIVLDDDNTVEKFIAELDNNRLAIASQRKQRKTSKKETSFVKNVKKRMESQKSNWILNELLLGSNILRFSHTRIRTFAIFISFTPKDPRGIEVNFNEIQIAKNVLHKRQWTPFDSALHYQLLVELPYDLRKLCPTSESLFQLLQQVEDVTRDVLKTGRDMLYHVLTSPASLIKESSGSIYIRKLARTKTPQNDVRRTEFIIEVRNIKQLSYKSIVLPPLYEFDEKIQMLPVGVDFVRVFLADPIQYLKTC